MNATLKLEPVPYTPSATPVLGARTGVVVEFAPGKRGEFKSDDPIPRFCIAELVPLGGATYRAIPRVAAAWVGLKEKTLAELGITASQTTLRRLGAAGFIEMRQISPNRYEFQVESWFSHCERVRSNPEFWESPCGKGETAALRMRSNRQLYCASI